MTTPTGTDPLDVLREVDPARRGHGPDASWAAETRAAIVAGDRRDPAPRRVRRWAGVAVAGTGVVAVAALMAVLLVAGGGDDGPADGDTPVVSLEVSGGAVTPGALEDAAAVVRTRAGLLGLEGVTVTVDGSTEVIRVEGDLLEPDLEALAVPGRLRILNLDRGIVGTAKPTRAAAVHEARADAGLPPGGAEVPAGWVVAWQPARGPYAESWMALRTAGSLDEGDVASARADGDGVALGLEDDGAAAFTRLTREIAQDGALRGRPQRLAVVVDGVLVSTADVDYELYPNGFDGRQGLVVPVGTRDDARRLAAVLSAPLALGAAELRYTATPRR